MEKWLFLIILFPLACITQVYQENINDTHPLKLAHNQAISPLQVSVNDVDLSNILYSRKPEGFYKKGSKPNGENTICYPYLAPGTSPLKVRAISNEDKRIVLQESSMGIPIAPPFRLTFWTIFFYIGLFFLIAATLSRILFLKKQRKVSNEKIRFFIHTAHDIRTPLTLIKAPLEELHEKEVFSKEGISNMNMALRNVNALLHLTTNLINFERTDAYASELYISEHELNTFMNEIVNAFRQYTDNKHIDFTYESNFGHMDVWFDKDKMEAILKNIISNALKYTPENGSVRIFVAETPGSWSVEVRDTGIGIPANEQKKLFKLHFRGSNAINSQVTGSGIGLMIVRKLVRLHKGKVQMSSVENQGSSVKITFPKHCKRYRKAHLATPDNPQHQEIKTVNDAWGLLPNIYETPQKPENAGSHQRILIAEENDDCVNCVQDIDRKFIASVKKNVEDNIASPTLTIDVLCSLMGMSRTSFYNKLRALTNRSPGDYIRLIRLKCAVKLLQKNAYSITEIAEMTGFNDAKYFRKVFKKYYNVSPSQYFKENKKIAKK